MTGSSCKISRQAAQGIIRALYVGGGGLVQQCNWGGRNRHSRKRESITFEGIITPSPVGREREGGDLNNIKIIMLINLPSP